MRKLSLMILASMMSLPIMATECYQYNSGDTNFNKTINFLNEDVSSIGNILSGEDQRFIIYDDKFNENKAVSLQYVRSVVYYDYDSKNTVFAEEFRAIETDDIHFGELNGDYWGDDYEVIDYDYFTGAFEEKNL